MLAVKLRALCKRATRFGFPHRGDGVFPEGQRDAPCGLQEKLDRDKENFWRF